MMHEPSTDLGTLAEPQPLSKSAQKKLAKVERIAAQKLERRAREKEAKKEKKRILSQRRAAGELDEEELQRLKKRRKTTSDFHGKVIVDLGFDDKMLDKEIRSLCSQLAYTYSANRNHGYPFDLLFTSIKGETKERLESMSDQAYKRWVKTEWWDGEYDGLWSGQAEDDSVRKSVVYLTADAEDELTELREDEIYIIGGIVDHNRYKNLCLNKAKDTGVRVAKLPIGRYLAELQTRKVLTVNQAFEILLKWVETKDWKEALLSVMPKRKLQPQGGSTRQEEDEDNEEHPEKIDEKAGDETKESCTERNKGDAAESANA